ncbi:GNAT family N-acetyltransferase [Pseudactinotalea suaedae]|uniref:GNAT family N-acetyltransferase n=1 Tax=Pseudactinotalea suaedae TaxID=1524924 RepID=UPI001F4FD0D2|nr:GNAT family N-acetyltransferase [Pseudactinotalea suaedae]
MSGPFRVARDSPSAPDVAVLLHEHLAEMAATSPADSVHALGHAALQAADIEFVTAREQTGALLGCGALKVHDQALGELKSMRTVGAARGQGVASAILRHLLERARVRGLARVSLETGAEDYFAPARRLYAHHGFQPTTPFADYTDDPNSVYLTLALAPGIANQP